MVLAFGAVAGWVLFDQGLAAATAQAFGNPALLLAVVAVTVLSAGFHEFGHAAAARYGGSTPGAMGFGIYLFWPAFYTDVTDSYRLGRAGPGAHRPRGAVLQRAGRAAVLRRLVARPAGTPSC